MLCFKPICCGDADSDNISWIFLVNILLKNTNDRRNRNSKTWL